MALIFPISASIGQTYQSGSSNTYEWTGTYWKIKNVINFNAFSASIVNRIDNISVGGGNVDSSSLVTTGSFNSFTSSVQTLSASFDLRIKQATNEQDLSYLATTGSNTFRAQQIVSGAILLSGSLVPAIGNGTFTSSFSLGSPTNAWKDLYISHGSIVFVDAVTQATSSFTIAANQEVQYSNGITASYYEGDGSRLFNLPSTTNWNKDKAYILRKSEQLTFSGDYILENCALIIEGSVPNSIGEWTNVNPDDNDGRITRTSNNTYRIDGANDDSGSGQVYIKRFFNTPTTMSIGYEWRNEDEEEDWPIFEVSVSEPMGSIDDTNMLDNNSAGYETGSWIINIPANNWLAIGVYSTDSCCGSGSLNLTLPYIINEDSVQYASNKYFKKEGSIFIGGNLLLKDSYIVNDGKISVGGEVILIGDSHIEGTGIII